MSWIYLYWKIDKFNLADIGPKLSIFPKSAVENDS